MCITPFCAILFEYCKEVMKELFHIVADLLRAEACVVVPEFGGFVVNRKPASIDAHTGVFCPPMVQVVFNQKLKHNDGFVCQEWATRHNCSLGEAAKQVATVVTALNETLLEKETLVIPEFGTLRKTGHGVSFVSSINQNGFSENFGLQEFYMPVLKKPVTSFSQVKKYVGVGIAAAVATLLFVPFNSDALYSNMASFMPVSQKTTCGAALTLETVANSAEQMQQASAILSAAPKVEAKEQEDNARFYVVLKRFANQHDADAFVSQWQSRLKDSLAVMPVSDDFYAVSCANTKNATLAAKMMDNVRKNSSFKETFILYK